MPSPSSLTGSLQPGMCPLHNCHKVAANNSQAPFCLCCRGLRQAWRWGHSVPTASAGPSAAADLSERAQRHGGPHTKAATTPTCIFREEEDVVGGGKARSANSSSGSRTCTIRRKQRQLNSGLRLWVLCQKMTPTGPRLQLHTGSRTHHAQNTVGLAL